MTARELYLGLDVGTQGTKGLVLDPRAGVVARAGARYGLLEGLGPRAAEQHPATWIAAVGEVARELWAALEPRPGELRGIGVSGQQHGLVVLDAAGDVVRPAKLWCDTECAEEAAELSRALGRGLPAGFTAPKVLWMRRREPARWAAVRSVLLPHEYVNLRLSGRAAAECGDASGTGWFDPRTRTYDPAALELLGPGFADLLPPLMTAGEVAGTLDGRGARLLGLPPEFVGVPLASGGGDNMLSAIGAGATREGIAVLSLGTSATIFTRSATPVVDPSGAIAPFCDSTGAWLPLLCVMNATGVLEELAAAFGLSLAELTRLAAEVPAGSEGLLLVPYLVGERVPDLPQASGTLLGLRPGNLRPGALFRAALEGIAANLALGAGRMTGLGLRLERVRVVGGGAHNALWRRILAAALDAPLERCAEPESAALGAALQALWTVARREDPALGVDGVAAAHVRTAGEPEAPDPLLVAFHAEHGARFRAEVERLYGAAPARSPAS